MKRAWPILVLLLAGVALSYFLFSRARLNNARQETQLGQFELLDVTVAGQPFREGSPLQHLSEKINPLGVKLGELEIRRPTRYKDHGDAPMTAWIRYRGTKHLLTRPAGASPLWWGSRAVVVDSAGKEYESSVPLVRRSTSTEMLLSIPLVAFPTDEPEFSVRFSPPPTTGKDREWVEFRAKNPLYLLAFNWSTNSVPQTNEVNGIKIVLREVTLRPASCQFEVSAPRWSVDKCSIEGADETQHIATGVREQTTPGQTLLSCRFFRQNLDVNQSWHIHISLRNLSDLPREAYRTLHLTSNASPQSLTNQTGQVFACAFDGWSLSITGPADVTRSNFGWILRGATNATTGEALKLPPFATSWPRPDQPFLQSWPPLPEPCSQMIVELAFPSIIRTEFHLQKDSPISSEWTKR